jgi:adenine-specific DNA-methyltransferase
MKIIIKGIKDSLNKAYQKLPVTRNDFELFNHNLDIFINSINELESEEHNKNNVMKFLEDSFYKGKNYINTHGRTDLVIHKDNKANSPVAVMIEAKSPTNKSEMITVSNLNNKAFHELVLYYLRERIENKNFEIKKLIITNAYEWFIFDAKDFEKYFYDNRDFRKQFESWQNSGFVDTKTKTFYEFTENQISKSTENIECCHFDLRTREKNTDLYKVFAPEYLLNKPFANDSNSLNKEFYYELLYILGLEEKTEGGKKVLQRFAVDKRLSGTIIENTINKLRAEGLTESDKIRDKYGNPGDEQYFTIALELILLWLNRILFMKLLESQLLRYNNKDEKYKFLNPDTVNQYDKLNTLFFEVLNTNEDKREQYGNNTQKHIPYLNSSLFEVSEIEHDTLRISGLNAGISIPLYNKTVLKDRSGKRIKKEMLTQEYLLRFLDAYDFGQTEAGEIVEDRKELISASVLGLVFEKINGYKDGSYFTPGFITMYMARESVRLAAVQKFNDKYGWKLKDFTELYNKIDKISEKEANEVIDDLKVCDPAVGSGHFLVSVLNEIIAVKSELKILIDKNGKRLRDFFISVENDELHIENEQGQLFEYKALEGDSEKGRKINTEVQRVQETIFGEKRKLIENCLFGVDINPNSVQICRLRLWIELLKSAYYTKESEYKRMETLPNIDINIKCGNSLVSKYGFGDVMPQKDIASLEEYKLAVAAYKNTTDRQTKADLKRTIEKIKTKFKGFWQPDNTERIRLAVELNKLNTEIDPLADDRVKERTEKKKQKLIEKMDKLLEEEKANNNEELYRNAFEWRFEFPEVLDDEGNFTGFDVVIGNPPYVSQKGTKDDPNINYRIREIYRAKFETAKNIKTSGGSKLNLFSLWAERALSLLSNNSEFLMIVHKNLLKVASYKKLRKLILDKFKILEIVDLRDNGFDGITAETIIIRVINKIEDYIISTKFYEENKKIENYFVKKIDQRNFLDNDDYIFNIYEIPFLKNIRFGKNIELLGDIIDIVAFGLDTIDNKRFVSDEEIDHKYKPAVMGRHIQKWHRKSICYVLYSKNTLSRDGNPEVFNKDEKIITQRVSSNIIACYDKERLYCFNSTNILHSPKSKYEIKYILSIMNSKLIDLYYRKTFSLDADFTVNVTIGYLKNLPIMKVSKKEQKPFIDLVDKILEKKEAGEDTSKEEAEIDRMVYELYGLSEEEIKIVEGE